MIAGLQELGVEVRDDRLTRRLYATDGSIYQVLPQAVAFPKSPEEAARLLKRGNELGIELIPRGAGTGLVGGALGEGVVIDFARYNTQIHGLDRERRRVHVGPGVVLDQLNRFLKPHGLMFGPDVATSSRATIGGMIANNSSGARVPRYGTTADHVHRIEAVTLSGELTSVTPQSPAFPDASRLLDHVTMEQASRLSEWRDGRILKRWPGYALHQWEPGSANWPAIFCGSEGTLAGFVGAELNCVLLPSTTALGLVYFDSIAEAMHATVAIQALDPSAIEHIDRVLLDQTRDQLQFRAARAFLDLDQRPTESLLIVEFDQDPSDRLEALHRLRLGTRTQSVTTVEEKSLVWGLRKAGLSLLTGCAGAAKPTTGIEDAAIPPKQLPDYVAALREVLDHLGLEACFYGHAASGLLHVRPVVDLHNEDDKRRFHALANEVAQLVKAFKGSLAAEHGVGLARTEYLPEQIGPELFKAMQALKHHFDPENRLNPGKIFRDARYAFDGPLRVPRFNEASLPFRPQLRYAAKDRTFTAHLEQCNGCGGCRKATPTMCPTFMVTGEESLSTRGRANLIRTALDAPSEAQSNPLLTAEIDHALRHCLACKACATECPSNVNLALLKAELSHARHQLKGIPWTSRLIGNVDRAGRIGTRFPGLSNALLKQPSVRRLMRNILGLTDRRPLPSFASQRFDHWFQLRPQAQRSSSTEPQVWLWDDTFTRYHEPHIGQAAVQLLEAAGLSPQLVPQRHCCGRPAFSQGLLDQARRDGSANVTQLARTPGDTPILFLEPSCLSMFLEDYVELGIPKAEAVAARCFLVEDYLAASTDLFSRPIWNPTTHPIAIHPHCHSKALLEPQRFTAFATQLVPGQLTTLATGCCGMAGAFGAMEETFELSGQVAGPLVQAIDPLAESTPILASGTSCRHQIDHFTNRTAQHPIAWLADQLKGEGEPA